VVVVEVVVEAGDGEEVEVVDPILRNGRLKLTVTG
jgi:hypothetical protein